MRVVKVSGGGHKESLESPYHGLVFLFIFKKCLARWKGKSLFSRTTGHLTDKQCDKENRTLFDFLVSARSFTYI